MKNNCDNVGQIGGNTKVPNPEKVDKDSESRCWFFTWNNYTFDDVCDIETWILERKAECVFQEEEGENGTPHLQGCFRLKSSIRFSTLKKRFPEIHWEQCRDFVKAKKYCSKEDTRIYGPYYYNMKKPVIKEERITDDLFNIDIAPQWQKDIIELTKTIPDERKIYWYYDKEGNSGKTTLARHLCADNEDEMIYVSGKAADIKYAVTEFVRARGKTALKLCLFDFPRTSEKFISYQAVEEIKNGIFFSGKYDGGMVTFNRPHVIIFANFKPDFDALSKDRWEYRIIEK